MRIMKKNPSPPKSRNVLVSSLWRIVATQLTEREFVQQAEFYKRLNPILF